jgi:hypothetical protein
MSIREKNRAGIEEIPFIFFPIFPFLATFSEKNRSTSRNVIRLLLAGERFVNAFPLLLDQFTLQVKTLFPHLHAHQQKTLALTTLGVIASGNAVTQRIAEELTSQHITEVYATSNERRLARFFANDRVNVALCWAAFLSHILPSWNEKKVTLVLDCMPFRTDYTIIYVGLLVHTRILPLAWDIMPQTETWETGQWEIVTRLFDQVATSLHPKQTTLLADRGLACLELIQMCKKVGWHYVLRISGSSHFIRRYHARGYRWWQTGKEFLFKPGQHWYGRALVWKEHSYEAFISACWEEGYDEEWVLISDVKASHSMVSLYSQRMKVEATFQDTKSRCWCIESSAIRDRERLRRWFMVVFLAMWWVCHLSSSCIHNGHREMFDRHDRRDKSMLRLGRLWLIELIYQANLGQPSIRAARLAHCLPFRRAPDGLRYSIDFGATRR